MSVRDLACFRHVDWSPDRRELRKFAVAMLIGFAVLGALAAWRRHGVAAPSLALWGAGLVLAAAAVTPGLGRPAYLAVYLPTSIIGYVVSHVLLTVIFFLVFTPLGAALRLAGKDLLELRPRIGGSLWTEHPAARGPDSYYHPF